MFVKRNLFIPPYHLLAFLLFCWADLPKPIADPLRDAAVLSLSPFFQGAKAVRSYLADRPIQGWGEKKELDREAYAKLELENTTLRTQIDTLLKWVEEEQWAEKNLEKLEKLELRKKEERPFFERRAQHLASMIRSQLISMPARCVYRDPAIWGSSLWIDVGEEDNLVLGRNVIARNSPVVCGASLVGVIEYVGKKQSRVRLITDVELSPAVRAVRRGKKDVYLAKGVLHGSGHALWRSRSQTLKGIGFNFDIADEEGSFEKGMTLLEKGDVVVTTGLDGVFPPDLEVGVVTEVLPPKPGGYAYEIEVCSNLEDLNRLQTLFVLPPRSE